jgi:hypothetical protein
MGNTDRIIRIAAAAVFAVLIVTGAVQGTFAIVLGVFAAVFVLTSVVKFCPLYVPFKIDTTKKGG